MVTWPVPAPEEVRLHVAGVLVALESGAVLPPTVTVDPINCSADVASEACCSEISVCRLLLVLICCSTEENSTSCWVN